MLVNVVKNSDPVLEPASQSWDSCSESRAPLCCRLTRGGCSGPPRAHSIRANGSPHDWRVAPLHPSGLAHRGLTLPYPSHVAWGLYLLADINALFLRLLPLTASLFHDAANLWLPYPMLLHYSCLYVTAADDFPNSLKKEQRNAIELRFS